MTKIVRQTLFPHLFLLLRLPEEDSPDLQHQQYALLRLFSDFLKSPELRVPQLNVARQAFGVWAGLQSSGRIVPERLAAAINELSGGGHLPLFIREQNAGLLISVPTLGTHGIKPNPSDEQVAACDRNTRAVEVTTSPNRIMSENLTAVISAFPASLPTSEVMSVSAPTFIYPATSVRVCFSSLLKSNALAEQISLLNETNYISSSVRVKLYLLIQIASILSCSNSILQ